MSQCHALQKSKEHLERLQTFKILVRNLQKQIKHPYTRRVSLKLKLRDKVVTIASISNKERNSDKHAAVVMLGVPVGHDACLEYINL